MSWWVCVSQSSPLEIQDSVAITGQFLLPFPYVLPLFSLWLERHDMRWRHGFMCLTFIFSPIFHPPVGELSANLRIVWQPLTTLAVHCSLCHAILFYTETGLRFIYTMEYYSAIKKNTFESVLMRWMKLEPIIQSEVSQKEKHQYSILTHIYGI